MIFLLLWSLVFGCPLFTQGAVTLQANGLTPSTTFSGNNVFAHSVGGDDGKIQLYMGRSDTSIPPSEDETIASYAVSVAAEGFDTVYPYANKTVRLNNLVDQPNPVFGEQIALMGTFMTTPVMVLSSALQNIYWNKSRVGVPVQDVYSIENITDANGAITSKIVALAGANINAGTSQIVVGGNYIFAAVAPNGGSYFGPTGSGVAVVGPTNTPTLAQLPAVTGTETIQAVAIDGTQSFVKIGSDAIINQFEGSQTTIAFDPILQRFYIGYQAFSAGGVTDGARGVVVGYINPVPVMQLDGTTVIENKLVLTDFAPGAAYLGADGNYVSGVYGASKTVVTTQKITSMYTSTGLTYAIIQGTSDPETHFGGRTVLAVPLVNKSVDPNNTTWPTDPVHGSVASKIINPGTNLQTYFLQTNIPKTYYGRGFQVPATTLADMPLQDDPAVWVGGSDTPGFINDIQVFKDSVFIATSGTTNNATGVFASQAIFDGYGAIKAWTSWQRISFPAQSGMTVWGLAYQQSLGKMFCMIGSTAQTVDTITTSTWANHNDDGLLGGTLADSTVGFIAQLNRQFGLSSGGIQGSFDFPFNTDGFTVDAEQVFSAMVFTGYKKITLVQTSAVQNPFILTPTIGDFGSYSYISTDGSVGVIPADTLMITISGEALDSLGGITSAAIVNDGANFAYLVVGGVGGIAVLQPGWPTAGLQKNFSNLPASAFTVLGSYKNVRKLLNDGTNLYVVTNTTVDRIPASQLSGTTITPVTVATASSIGSGQYNSFSDVIISSKMGLLATAQGLFRVGNGQDIATATSSSQVNWTLVSMGESLTAVTRLTPFSATGLPQDFSTGPGGNVYALSGSISQGLASLYRISVADTSGANAVVNTTVQVIPDYFVEGTTSAFAAYGGYRNYFRTDGALITDSRSSYVADKPIFEALPPFIRTGSWLMANKEIQIPLGFSPGATVGGLLRNSGLGSLILPVNTGIQVLE